jgi:hypothetical protein
MVADSRKTLGVDKPRVLNAPVAVGVKASSAGLPEAVRRADWPDQRRIVRVQEIWRIDDEWWRERPISRIYYQVLLQDDMPLTLYQDQVDGQWYEQRYGGWRTPVRRFRTRGQHTRQPAVRPRQPRPIAGRGDLPRIRIEP